MNAVSKKDPMTILARAVFSEIELADELTRSKALLKELTSLRDWMHEGYSIDEYNDFRETGKLPDVVFSLRNSAPSVNDD